MNQQFILGAVAGFILWELWALVLSPKLFGITLRPTAVIKRIFQLENPNVIWAIHALIGLLIYPLLHLGLTQRVALYQNLPPLYQILTLGTVTTIIALLSSRYVGFNSPSRLILSSTIGHLLQVSPSILL